MRSNVERPGQYNKSFELGSAPRFWSALHRAGIGEAHCPEAYFVAEEALGAFGESTDLPAPGR